MQFGVAFASRVGDHDLVRLAEDLGFDQAWFYDSQMIYSDVYATMALAAYRTKRIRLGTGVAVPTTRIAPVIAHSIATINQLAPGRVELGIGVGNTARLTMGQPPVRFSKFRDEVRIIRRLLDGETATLRAEGARRPVNNALSTIGNLFPHRRIVKVGDPLRHEALDAGVETSIHEDGARGSFTPVSSDTITGMTFTTALNRLVLRRSALAPHVILIDEAGQLPLPHGITVGLIGASSVLLFGDDRQMPPIFPANLSDDPLAVSLFARVREVMPESVLMLDTTYRMNEPLCSFIGRSFYADAAGRTHLKPSPEARDRLGPLLSLPHSTPSAITEALDSAHSLVWVRSPIGANEQYNPMEARFVADLIVSAMRARVPAHGLAVVTPFRRQVALIRSLIREAAPGAVALPIVDTVERVQGLTVEIVAVSLSASDPAYADVLRSFLQSPNRMNVAASRARSKVVIVAASSALSTHEGDPLEPFVSLLARTAHVIQIHG